MRKKNKSIPVAFEQINYMRNYKCFGIWSHERGICNFYNPKNKANTEPFKRKQKSKNRERKVRKNLVRATGGNMRRNSTVKFICNQICFAKIVSSTIFKTKQTLEINLIRN